MKRGKASGSLATRLQELQDNLAQRKRRAGRSGNSTSPPPRLAPTTHPPPPLVASLPPPPPPGPVATYGDCASSGAAVVASGAPPPSTEMRMRVIPVAGDGDCLFSAIQHALRNATLPQRAIIDARLAAIGISACCVDVLATHVHMVRTLSVMCIMRDVGFVRETLHSWRQLYNEAVRANDAAGMAEFRHMRCVSGPAAASPGDDNAPLTLSEKEVLFAAMLDKSTYWGNEFDLAVLQLFLGVQFLVVTPAGDVLHVPHAVDPEIPAPARDNVLFITLLRHENHFEALECSVADDVVPISIFWRHEVPRRLVDATNVSLRALSPFWL